MDWQNWLMPTKKAGSVAVMTTTTTSDASDRAGHQIPVKSSNLGYPSHLRNTRDKNKKRFGASLLRFIEPQQVCIDLAWPFPRYRYNMRLLEVFNVIDPATRQLPFWRYVAAKHNMLI